MTHASSMAILLLSLLMTGSPVMADDSEDDDAEHRLSDEVYEGAKSGKILSLVDI